MSHLKLTIEGMTCEHCVRAVRGRLEKTDGVKVGEVHVGSATLDFDPGRTSVSKIEDAIADEGYTAFVSD
jgi:copper chaperone CopZ